MNDFDSKIRELAESCNISCNDDRAFGWYVVSCTHIQLERFVKLIIEEYKKDNLDFLKKQ